MGGLPQDEESISLEMKMRQTISRIGTIRNEALAAFLLLCFVGFGLISCGGSASSPGGSGSGSAPSGSGGSGSVQYVNISGGTTNFVNPLDVAVDGAGNVWFTNFVRSTPSSSSQSTQGGVTELTKASGFSAASAFNISGGSAEYDTTKIVAIDPSGNVWVTNGLSGDVVELTKTSGYSATAAIEVSGLDDPSGIAADPAGDIWIADWGSGMVWELPYSAISAPGATGASIAAQAIGIGGFSFPSMVTVDPSGNVWVTNLGTMFLQQGTIPGSIVELTKASNYSPAGIVKITGWDGNDVVPFDIAADSSGNIWMTGATLTASGGIGTPVVTELTKSSNYSPASAVNITGWETLSTTGSPTQVNAPAGIAIDGGGNVWLTVSGFSLNTTTQQATQTGGIVELTKASNYSFSSAVNYSSSAAGFDLPMGIAIDGSGNVWVAESGVFLVGAEIQAVSQSASITELVQAAVPVTTPLP